MARKLEPAASGPPSRRRKLVLLGISATIFTAMVIPLVAYDVYLHQRAHNLVNVWGYRGPVLGDKRPGEVRVAVLGGSTAYGYGVQADESFPAYLATKLRDTTPPGQSVSVANLGYMAEGAHSFVPTLDDFAFLEYDVVILYTGYNDLRGNHEVNTLVFRRQSPIFRLIGYYPVLPVMLREKALILRYGSLEAASADQEITFEPSLARRAAATALEAAVSTSERVGLAPRGRAQPGHSTAFAEVEQAWSKFDRATSVECGFWSSYCGSIRAAIEHALQHGKAVIVVTQPFFPTPIPRRLHIDQQRELAAMVQRHFGSNRHVRHVNLGHALDLNDKTLAWDEIHLTPLGNRRLADALAPAVREVVDQRRHR